MHEQPVLDALAQVGVRRRDKPVVEGVCAREVDLVAPRRARRALDRVAVQNGFHRLVAPGRGGHRFYVDWDGSRLVKLDVVLEPRRSRDGRGSALMRRLPVGLRRRGPVIALLGGDGAGKSTVARRLDAELPVATRVVYLGSARRHRSGTAEGDGGGPPAGGPARVRLRLAIEWVFVLRRIGRMLPSLARAHVAAWRGVIVLCDRHPLEALAVDPRRTRLARWVERFVVTHVLPSPDLLLLLEAPGTVMHARKGEHDPERLDRERQAHRETFLPRGARVVDTSGDPDTAVRAAAAEVWAVLAERRGWTRGSVTREGEDDVAVGGDLGQEAGVPRLRRGRR